MIKIENIETYGWEAAFRGFRNPKESWHKSDSKEYIYRNAIDSPPFFFDDKENNVIKRVGMDAICFEIGENDMKLARALILAGSDHAKFTRQIGVSMDITAPLYWWKEWDQYKVGTTTNSTSTMHKIMERPFSIDMFSCEQLRGYKKIIEQTPNEIDEDSEEWREFPLNSLYYISNQGRVKRKQYTTLNNRVWKERILTNTETTDHYLKVGIKINDEQKDKRVHQLVALTWLENPNNYKEVNHINGNKLDNRVENLEWCSSKQNQDHAIDNSLQPKNIYTYKGKLSKEQRDEVINLFNSGEYSRREIGKKFGVSHTTVSAIINNKYNYGEGYNNEYEDFLKTIDVLNELRDEWLLTQDYQTWYNLIQLLPSSWNQKRTVTLNYQVARNMYLNRKSHKLNEWHDFCDMIDTLPYSSDLISIKRD